MQTFHLHLTGVVQGVGFRPFVYRLARQMGLEGTVSNGSDGVHIYINADEVTAKLFQQQVVAKPPVLAHIQQVKLESLPFRDITGFTITESNAQFPVSLLLTPDVALCEACRTEMTDPQNDRFGYGFTSCTQCGPRYSITRQLPYDRPTTTMHEFSLCASCQNEYQTPDDRRFYAQTNSCPKCAVSVQLYDQSRQPVARSQSAIIEDVIHQLQQGGIVAAKGIGGYLLLCDATQPEVVNRLRQRKHRPAKPLAVLYPNRAVLQHDCRVSEVEWEWLNGPVSPVLLLERFQNCASGLAVDVVAPRLNRLGVMLPYAPLLELIATGFGKPLVATSGNLSGSSIVYTDNKAVQELSQLADFVLTHNREIVVPQDDSVVQLTPFFQQPIVLRRARGLAPTVLQKAPPGGADNVLALGASLKSTFAWQRAGNTYLSQYLGNLESFDAQQQFQATLDHFVELFGQRPDRLLADAHEGYFSTQLAYQLSAQWGVPVCTIQHHEAHLAAVLAEHQLLRHPEPILGVVWDGTGYGTDGHIWGGEFFRYMAGEMERVAHLAYFDAILGDKMPREPRLSALSATKGIQEASALLEPSFTATEWTLYAKILARNTLKTSSVGRLFDAVACLLGLSNTVSYEGEAALLLEEQAWQYVRREGLRMQASYFTNAQPDTHTFMQRLVADIRQGLPFDFIAAKVHYSFVQLIKQVADSLGIRSIACSGGVFQNALLVDWLQASLSAEYQLYFHRQLSPNDESVSFGQLSHYQVRYTTSLIGTYDNVFSNSR